MSGLFGYCNGVGRTAALPVVEQMGQVIRHQPYHVIDIAAPTRYVALGRHAIGVFNRAPQPVSGAGGQVQLTLCGEFYHQRERRAALVRAGKLAEQADDSELALQVYLSEGASGLTRLEGAFTVAVWDGRSGELIVVNDRFGLYPHYIAHYGGAFVFAPEIKGVLCAPCLPRRLDMAALAEYIRFQQILGDKTWFEDIQLLPPATLLRYRTVDDRLTLAQYWDWDMIGCQPTIQFDEAVEEVIRLFQRAIDAMTATPHRVGVYLSGGLDGRAILGFIDRQVPVTTLTFGAAGCRDVVYAAELARRAASRHHWFPLHDGRWVLDHADLHLELTEGMHSWMHGHGMNTLTEARSLIDVNLSGWDGGTVFGGLGVPGDYEVDWKVRHPPSEADLTRWMYEAFCRDLTWPGLTEQEANRLFGSSGAANLHGLAFESFRAELARSAHYPADRRPDYFYIRQHNRRSTQNMIVFARSAFEVRCPFFDYDVISFMYSLPEHIRATPELYRAVITRRMPHLAMVPYEKDDRLPHSNPLVYHTHATWQRTKHWINQRIAPIFPNRPRLYADYEEYLRTDLRDWAESILFDPRTEERGLFDPHTVRSLWDRHLSAGELWTIGKIAPLITVELVLRRLYDELALKPVSLTLAASVLLGARSWFESLTLAL
jgi:asparagine synthase (glutamine-hydrolysing)